MEALTLRNLDGAVLRRLGERARLTRRPIEVEAAEVLADVFGAANSPLQPQERVARARAIASSARFPQLTDGVQLLREERES